MIVRRPEVRFPTGHVCNAGCRDDLHTDVAYGSRVIPDTEAFLDLQWLHARNNTDYEILEAMYAPEAMPIHDFADTYPERAAYWRSQGFSITNRPYGYRYTFRVME
jgi:hypothetical protein